MSVQDKSHTLKHLTVVGDSERTRTSNLLIRSQGLYPLSYGAFICHSLQSEGKSCWFSGGKGKTCKTK